MRGLSKEFLVNLKNGFLMPILELVKSDGTLCLEIRDNYINIYYRGGNLLRVQETKKDTYDLFFDRKYLDESRTRVPNNLAKTITIGISVEELQKWIDAIPFMKHEMDLWFGKNYREREFQQLVVMENNLTGAATGTDYFICDIEYACTLGRFDMVAVCWPSSGPDRKNNSSLRLALIEMKYLDKSLCENAGMVDHLRGTKSFVANPQNVIDLKEEMKIVFNQKLELGLINNQKPIESFSDEKPEYIIILANHDPDSTILDRELNNVDDDVLFDLKFAVSNFMGYGLYKENMYDIISFREKFSKQINSKYN